jgi:predicted ribosomally synthesized peptide with nif11-like leader
MAIADIKAFSELAKTDAELKEKLVACMKLREILNLAKEYGFNLDEVELYPPNEPQFTEEQLSEKMAKALLRV